MKKAGHAISNNLCAHFAMTRQELFTIIKYGYHQSLPSLVNESCHADFGS